MGAIAAAFDKKDKHAPLKVLTMLNELRHRGTMEQKVFSHPSAFVAQSMSRLDSEEITSEIAVGTNGSEPVLGQNYVWIFEGHHFPPFSSITHRIMHKSDWNPLKISRYILKELDGSYTFTTLLTDRILVGRDIMGLAPLYYGENESICAIASERKALWRIGLTDVASFPPGNLATISSSGFTFEPIATLESPVQKEMKMARAAECLKELLKVSTLERVSDVDKVAVAFSGGLDSSVLAKLAWLGSSAQLICTGLKGQKETETAKDAARMLEQPISIQTFSNDDIKEDLPKVLWLVEEPDVMKASIAMPLFWTAEIASKLGYRIMLAGQGADELFGGYHRYRTQYAIGGGQKLRKALFADIARAYDTNFQRDESVCSFHKVELRLPFCDKDVVSFALSLPIKLKIESPEDNLRKRVLRQTAKYLGIPDSIAFKPKKAIQFATGVDKALKDLAKKEGLTTRAYVKRVFNEVYPHAEVQND